MWSPAVVPAVVLSVVLAVLLGGCSGGRTHRMLEGDSMAAAQRGAGYALLVTLLEDEAGVDGILIIKSLPQPVSELIERIADAARVGARTLSEELARPPVVSLENDGLPLVEVGARQRIRQWRTVELLTGRGESLERALLVSQLQAVDTIRALAESLLEEESEAARVAALEHLIEVFTPIRAEVWEQLGRIGG